MGSVKDLNIEIPPAEDMSGVGVFDFSDRYSVFDWGGEMPDNIPRKGAALCMMAAYNFEMLEQAGIKTHYDGVLEGGLVKKTGELERPSTQMVVKLAKVVKPQFMEGDGYDYSWFIDGRGIRNNFVVPLEVIYRNGAPKGSSLFKTLKGLKEQGKDEERRQLLSKYGLTEDPVPGQMFPKTGYDFTTKYESTDRRVNDQSAFLISGLTAGQFLELQRVRNEAARLVGKRAKEVGFVDLDGKHEYVFFDGHVLVADVLGTFDENRFMLGDVQVSKEFLRQYHKTTQSSWVQAVENAKKMAGERNVADWKSLCQLAPQHLDERLVSLVGEMYAAGSDRYTGLNLFRARPLEAVMDDLKPYLGAS